MRRLLPILLTVLLLCGLCPAAHAADDAPAFAVVDITEMDIPALQQAVDGGYLTYEQIMLLYLERIEAYAQMYECLISVSDTALEEARECDRIYRRSGRSSLLFGLPVIVKDNINAAGMATTNGDKALAGSVAKTDAAVVAALREAGAIIVAKANMDAYADDAKCSISDYGRVNNAYDLNKTAYGSSGGSAVAAAASLAPVCLGTDTNSSIRVPASGNGVVGIRPTTGLLSSKGITRLIGARDTAGCMAKSVYDTALILSAMGGFETDYTASLSADALSGLRIGVVDNLARHSSREIARLFEDALAVLEAQGARIVRVTLPLGSVNGVVSAYRRSFVAALDRRDLDLVVYPTMRGAVLTHSAAAAGSNSNGYYIAPSAGAPAVTVPMGTDSSGVPSGLEFAARPGDDALVLAAAYAFEQALGLSVKTPLAPSLYGEAPAAIEALLALREAPARSPIDGFGPGYDEVTATYGDAVAYLCESYYDDADAARRAEALLASYDQAVASYEKGYRDHLAQLAAEAEHLRMQQLLVRGIAGSTAVMVLRLAVLALRRRK